jgi:hypothetical protein
MMAMAMTNEPIACKECGGSGHGPEQSVGAGDVEQGKCDRCNGGGLEPPPKDVLALVVTDLEPESALALRASFDTLFAQAEEWTARARGIRVTALDQKREMKLARESRLALRDIRVKAEHTRKRLKEDSTRRGKAIDGMANIIKALIEPIEIHLLEQETFAERHEAARKDALRSAREEALRALGTDPRAYANLGETSEETWAVTLDTAKAAHEQRIQAAKDAEAVRVEAERIAAQKKEEARVAKAKAEAERVEREKAQAEENAKLKAERELLERVRAEERSVAEEAARQNAAKAKAEREAAEEEARKARAEKDLAERELEAERAKVAAAARAEEERAAAERAAARAAELAPDREKLAAFAALLRGLPIPELTSPAGLEARTKVAEQITKMANWVEKTGASL